MSTNEQLQNEITMLKQRLDSLEKDFGAFKIATNETILSMQTTLYTPKTPKPTKSNWKKT